MDAKLISHTTTQTNVLLALFAGFCGWFLTADLPVVGVWSRIMIWTTVYLGGMCCIRNIIEAPLWHVTAQTDDEESEGTAFSWPRKRTIGPEAILQRIRRRLLCATICFAGAVGGAGVSAALPAILDGLKAWWNG